MGGRLIRWWWGERRDTESDWFTIWISASTDVQSQRFLSGLSCSFYSSLSSCARVGVHVCVGVGVTQLVGDREGRNVYGLFTAELLRSVFGPGTPDNCCCCSAARTLQNQLLPWRKPVPVNPIHLFWYHDLYIDYTAHCMLCFGSHSEWAWEYHCRLNKGSLRS